MKLKSLAILVLSLILTTSFPINSFGTNGGFQADPKTAYSKYFISACEGQSWFLNEVERLLNVQEKSINTINGKDELLYIKSIGLSGRGITGKIPKAVGELEGLEHLFLSGNKLEGKIPNEIFTLKNLKTIDLGGNKFIGDIPLGFSGMKSLETLVLKDNLYKGIIPKKLLLNKKIKVLNLSKNDLEGGIPAEIKNMVSLEYLNLSQNGLGGKLPDFTGLLNLKTLSLWDDQLTGEIDSSIYTLKNLQIFDIADNGINGKIKEDIGELEELELLNLAGNNISGTIPSAIEKQIKLKKIDLSGNKLRGVIPDIFYSDALKEIDISNNFLRGKLPESLKQRAANKAKVKISNNYITGEDAGDLEYNQNNFIDGREEQYQLEGYHERITISSTEKRNLYSQLRNRRYKDGNISQKILLKPDEYDIEVISGDASKIEIEVSDDGIYVKAKEKISETDRVIVRIRIRDNDRSLYSSTNFILSTEGTASGGTAIVPGGKTGEEDSKTDKKEKVRHIPYVTGYPDGNFKADKPISREETAKMIIAALEIVPKEHRFMSFNDVDRKLWSYKYIEEAKDRGYVKGVGNNIYAPKKDVTRAELAVILVRIGKMRGLVSKNEDIIFSDIEKGKWYTEDVIAASKFGLVKGYTDKSFKPNKKVSRAEAVTMINRMLERDPHEVLEFKNIKSPFKDLKGNYYAYYDILEAGVLHMH